MADVDPQARRDAEDRISSQIRDEIEAEMNRRFGTVGMPVNKQVYEAGVQGAANIKENAGNQEEYLRALQTTQRQIAELQQIQRREGQAYLSQLQAVNRMEEKSFKREMDRYNLTKNRKQLMKDIGELEAKGSLDKLNAGERARILEAREQLAEARAMEQQGLTTDRYIAAHGVGMPPGQMVGAGRGNMIGRLMTRWSTSGGRVRGYLGRQGLETGVAVSEAGGLSNIGGMVSAFARANPILTAAAGGFYALRGINEGQGLYIPGLGSIPGTDFQNQILAGRVTGEGYGAGLATEWEALQMGYKPWDLISMRVAHEIVNATRAQGLRGSRGRAYQATIKDIYQQTGLPIDQIAQMGDIYARRQGGLAEFRAALTQIDNIARDSGRSVKDVADGLQSLTQTLVGQGAAPGLLPAAITAAVGRNIPGLSNAGFKSVQEFIGGQGLQTFSGMPGVMSTTIHGRQLGFAGMRQFLRSTQQAIAGMPEANRQDYVMGLMQAGLLPQGSYKDALNFIRHGGRAISDFQHQERQQRLNAAFAAGQTAMDRAHHDPGFLRDAIHLGLRASDYIPGLPHLGFLSGSHHDRARQLAEQGAYIHGLRGSLRGTRLTKEQIDKIVTPLERTMRGQDVNIHGTRTHVDWHRAIELAQARAKLFAQKPKGTLNIKLDATETRRLLSGKNVSKAVQISKAVEGQATTIGTSLWDAVW